MFPSFLPTRLVVVPFVLKGTLVKLWRARKKRIRSSNVGYRIYCGIWCVWGLTFGPPGVEGNGPIYTLFLCIDLLIVFGGWLELRLARAKYY